MYPPPFPVGIGSDSESSENNFYGKITRKISCIIFVIMDSMNFVMVTNSLGVNVLQIHLKMKIWIFGSCWVGSEIIEEIFRVILP